MNGVVTQPKSTGKPGKVNWLAVSFQQADFLVQSFLASITSPVALHTIVAGLNTKLPNIPHLNHTRPLGSKPLLQSIKPRKKSQLHLIKFESTKAKEFGATADC